MTSNLILERRFDLRRKVEGVLLNELSGVIQF